MMFDIHKLDLNLQAKNLEELFHKIPLARKKKILDALTAYQKHIDEKHQNDMSIDPTTPIIDTINSKIHQTDEEFLFLLITASMFTGAKIERITIARETMERFENIAEKIFLEKGGKRAD